ncbi:hypothetical protein NBG4_190037 [Candidatus Sulfobium mesophilum]|uniref:Fibronectin type-III domain-containing protein n=1 Tax=Candidatus Sulfobium mesophilum TaxID=2016548 RepID=A0A2U3QFM9_9BACT|nr:hypothetical protein NBG4_190037 [Candidatus Sulfobium mesophilum]
MIPSTKNSMFSRMQRHFFTILLIANFILLFSCGKKGPPTLHSFEKPAPPSPLSVSQRENSIVLSWVYPPNREAMISGFIVLRKSDSSFEKIAMVESNLRTFIDSDVKEGSAYTYKVLTQNQRGLLSADSNLVLSTVITPPRPPANISWSTKGDSLLLSWEKTGDDIVYNVYKTVAKGSYSSVPVNKLPISETSFSDILSLGRPVYYTLRSLTREGLLTEGPASQEITVNPSDLVPPAPEDVRFFAASDRIYLYWKEPDAPWITGFRIYRKFEGGQYYLISETQIPSFLDKDTPAVKRDYRISAVGPSLEGPPSEIKGVFFEPE